MTVRKSLIICSPVEEPTIHLKYRPQTKDFEELEGRRKAGYWMATPGSKHHDDPGVWVPIPRVDGIRARVKEWRQAGYPGASAITRKLLEHWQDVEIRGDQRLFFCQLEAAETTLFLTEAPDNLRAGLDIPGNGGPFERWCCKLATGTGKTVVMAMLCAWQILNKVDRPQDPRFAKSILVMAPGRTVRERLQVLIPSSLGNYYEEFHLVPAGLRENLNLGKVLVRNWQGMQWESEDRLKKRRSVDKRGAKSDEAYVREVLGELEKSRNILVLNDEAHHAWRVNGRAEGVDREALEEATKWIGALDRIHRARGILRVLDFTATPFIPTGKQSVEDQLFPWIVSDFGLNDAIESGLVKTPRVVVRDDAQLTPENKSRFYHLYSDPEVKTDLNIKDEPERPLPPLLQQAYRFLALDWKRTFEAWRDKGSTVPPVLITVCNTTHTAERVKRAFEKGRVPVPELSESGSLLHIDARVLAAAEAEEAEAGEPQAGAVEADGGEEDGGPVRKLTKKERAELLRTMVDTVGKVGKPGQHVRNVVSVAMLSEGWDAKTVTHIMGLRAFSSQLLCEQVVGRGLRRTNYDRDPETGLFSPDYVNIFGVPFNFLPHEDPEGPAPPTTKPTHRIMALPERAHLAITWPNVLRLERFIRPRLDVDFATMRPLVLDAFKTASIVELAPISDGRPDVSRIEPIRLAELAGQERLQTVLFQAVRDTFEQMRPDWPASPAALLQQLFALTDRFLASGRIQIEPPLFGQDEARRRILLWCNATAIAHHLLEAIRFQNAEETRLVLDPHRPRRSTEDMIPWNTTKNCESVQFSHVTPCVFDSTWEASEAFILDQQARVEGGPVEAWVKNDHLGFEILYQWNGAAHRYRPDFLVRLKSGETLILETKGQEREQDRAKRAYAEEWVKAVNAAGSYGKWRLAVSRNPADLPSILK